MTRWWASLSTLWRLARRRSESAANYQEFQYFMAQKVVQHLETEGVSLTGARLLDVGAAWGAYGEALADAGAQVTCLDLTVDEYIRADPNRPFVRADATRIPVPDNHFDLVFCGSLVEHVEDSAALLQEIYRVVRRGGEAYVGFPPFYSPVGGHQFKPFHLLGERVAVKVKGRGATSYANSHERGGLYRRTIRGVAHDLACTGFEIEKVSTRFTRLNVARVPWLGEVLTWYVQFLVRKPEGGS